MLTPLIVFSASIFAIYLFLVYKANILSTLPEEEIKAKEIKEVAMETLSNTKDDFFRRVEELLQLFLSLLRKIIMKAEHKITEWLYILKKRKKEKSNDK
jgi:formate dehydrogenase maturation protein FdhE